MQSDPANCGYTDAVQSTCSKGLLWLEMDQDASVRFRKIAHYCQLAIVDVTIPEFSLLV